MAIEMHRDCGQRASRGGNILGDARLRIDGQFHKQLDANTEYKNV